MSTSSVATAAAGAIDFARDVQPILAAHCYKCHGAEKQESGLRLDRRGALLTEELTYGRAIVPGWPWVPLVALLKALPPRFTTPFA